MYVVALFFIERRLQMLFYTCVAFSHIVIDLGITKYKMEFFLEPLQHPPYNNFYKATFFHLNNIN